MFKFPDSKDVNDIALFAAIFSIFSPLELALSAKLVLHINSRKLLTQGKFTIEQGKHSNSNLGNLSI